MTRVGISTGALARGDFRTAWAHIERFRLPAVEFSALREAELDPLTSWLLEQDFGTGPRISVHAPSRRVSLSEVELVERLATFSARGWRVIVHPGIMETPSLWHRLGQSLCIENMDKRAHGRTAEELRPLFEAIPAASFCLDLGHARQMDSTMAVARRLLESYGSRLAQIHISEVDSECRHRRLSVASVWAIGAIARLIPDVPVIIESELAVSELSNELEMVERCFAPEVELARHLAPA